MKTQENLFEVKGEKSALNLHPGQWRAWKCPARFVAVVAGTQSGKTAFGPPWLLREIIRTQPGDYLVASPTYKLMERRVIPAFRQLFEHTLKLGIFTATPVHRFTWSKGVDGEVNVYFIHAQDAEGLESTILKAAWLDEVGQSRFRWGSWEAIQRRLSISQGRVLFTTTPYNLGWFKQHVYDRAAHDPDYHVIQFESTENPVFPQAEFERARDTLPAWKFRMFYLGQFERPAGLIYDAFDQERCVVPRMAVPSNWERFLGLDFGGINMAAVYFARDPDSQDLTLYRTERLGKNTVKGYQADLLKGEPPGIIAVGGAKSEDQWRREFRSAGLFVKEPPISSVEVGINRVYSLHLENRITVFDDLHDYLDEKTTYARLLDDNGVPTIEIEDKHAYHLMDAERYIISYIQKYAFSSGKSYIIPSNDPYDDMPPLIW